MIKAFPKIFAVGTRPVKSIFDTSIEVTEKLDGSQFVFGKVNDELWIRSKGKIMDVNYPDKMFTLGVEYILRIADLVPNNYVFYAEYMSKPKHNTLSYNRIPQNHLMLFGVSDQSQCFIDSYDSLLTWGSILKIDVAPLVYKGDWRLQSGYQEVFYLLKSWLNRESYLGGPKIEGVVIKNYGQSMIIGDLYYPIMSAKYVSEEFKEVHGATWSKDHTSKGGLESLKEQYCSEARWLKALFKMRDDGILKDAPQDIGPLIKAIRDDVIEEEKENIKDALWSIFNREIMGATTRGFPEWYKERLVKELYGEDASMGEENMEGSDGVGTDQVCSEADTGNTGTE